MSYRAAVQWLPAVLIALGSHSATAQQWPTRQPIKVVVPATAGSTSDIMSRTVYEQVGRQIGQTVITENRGGGGTTIGMAQVAKSEPDGYTLLVNSTSYVVVASTYAKLPYDPINDMIGIALLANLPLLVTTSTKFKTLAELIAAGQAKPTPLNFGSVGLGSSGHLCVERLMHAAKFEAKHVPFRGVPEAMTELVAGRIDMFNPPIPSMKELHADGKINAVAITSTKRSAVYPNLPTTVEAGYPGSDYNFWMGSYMPAKTPRAIVERLNAEVAKALSDPVISKKIVSLGGEIDIMGVDQFNAFIKSEREVNAQIVKLIGYKPQ